MYIYVQYVVSSTWGQADMLFNNLTIFKKCPDTVACAAMHMHKPYSVSAYHILDNDVIIF